MSDPIADVSLHTVDPRPHYPFIVAAKKYVPRTSHPDGYTFIMTHGTGYHKEHWEVTLRRLIELSEKNGYKIREAWGIDSPNHGDGGVFNDETLLWGKSMIMVSKAGIA